MDTRLLPREEWPRLVGTELETVWPVLPAGAQIVVVEQDETILACWALFPLVHLEGCWIAPEARKNPRVVRHLLRGMTETAHALGASTVVTGSLNDDVSDMLARLGAVELPGRHFSLSV